ncbi:MAG: ATP-dependent DNA helicase RecG [Bacilli bacterium]
MIFSKSQRINNLLKGMGIYSVYDLVFYLPYRYEDYSITEFKNIKDKQRVVLEGIILNEPKAFKSQKVSGVTFDFMSSDKHYFKVVAFNRDYLTSIINFKDTYTLVGQYNKNKNQINLINLNKGSLKEEEKIKPLYHLPSSLKNFEFSRLVRKQLNNEENKFNSFIPFEMLNKYHLVNVKEALNYVHFPKNKEELKKGILFFKYEEALSFSLKNLIIRNENNAIKKSKLDLIDIQKLNDLAKALPFKLTKDQITSIKEIVSDLNDNKPMYRILEGDVGSGKTLVAFFSLYANYLRNRQGALLAPTEALAKQHYLKALQLFYNTNINIKLLTGSTSNEEKRMILDDLKDGLIDIVIGTHSLFSKGVIYNSLSLVIIDEQHRFGVNQRNSLVDKGKDVDLLMMSATPIPRSLALTIYGDLSISFLHSFPTKERKVETDLLLTNEQKIFSLIDEEIKKNKKVYVITPLIEYSENHSYSIESIFPTYFAKYKNEVSLLHGELSSEEKERALDKFIKGESHILLSTQIVEVGIDIKEASLMIIYKASSFGLASLHQLRGRIGRDGNIAHCYLLYDKDDNEDSIKRLEILKDNNDGFILAEKDLSIRGPGEMLGIKQSGFPDFKYLNVVKDINIFTKARDDAKIIFDNRNVNKSFEFAINYINRLIKK